MEKDLRRLLKESILFFDGAMGTLLQNECKNGEQPEILNITKPSLITSIHRQYVNAGSDIITANTFGANALKFDRTNYDLERVISLAIANAKASKPRFVALDVGPLGQLLRPAGELDFERAVSLFKQQISFGVRSGIDLVLIETMSDLYELKAAIVACKECCDLPIVASMTFDETLRTFMGVDSKTAVLFLNAIGVDALGINCSKNPFDIAPIVDDLIKFSSAPVLVMPNAGLPSITGEYSVSEDAFKDAMVAYYNKGVSLFGGCCGTTPKHIEVLKKSLSGKAPINRKVERLSGITSGTRAVLFDNKTTIIGERINPTGKPRLKDALKDIDVSGQALNHAHSACPAQKGETSNFDGGAKMPLQASIFTSGRKDIDVSGQAKASIFTSGRKDIDVSGQAKASIFASNVNNGMSFIINEAILQESSGADLLDVNCGLPDIDESATIVKIVEEIQSVTSIPLQIDSANTTAIERAVRVYNGKPLINSVNGKLESMNSIFPIIKKYGASVIALTLDENGIPKTANERLVIAERILKAAIEFGISKDDIFIDCLVLTASAQQAEVFETIKAIRLIKERLGLKTVLGVSNVSFGLPNRTFLNSIFLTAALTVGLDAAIVNPLCPEVISAIKAFRVLNNSDRGAKEYISHFSNSQDEKNAVVTKTLDIPKDLDTNCLKPLIVSGQRENARLSVRELLNTHQPLSIINDYLIPSLDFVGREYEKGIIFIPQLIQAAETAKGCFELLKERIKINSDISKGKIVLATVKGDIHDIGKNIVKVVLESYGYQIIDLGKDVDSDLIVRTVVDNNIALVGLSALMTTTIQSMKEAIEKLRVAAPQCKIMVGGAVLTEEYTRYVGADFYSPDAMTGVKIADKVLEN